MRPDEMDHQRPSGLRGCSGFTLVEALTATAILSGAVMAVAQLSVLSSRSNLQSRDISYANVLASQKLAELSARAVSDLTPTSADAWAQATAGALDYLDGHGAVVTPGDVDALAIYVRRWSITPIAGDTTGGVVIEVSAGRVHRLPSGVVADAEAFDVARVVGVRTARLP